MEAPPSPAQTLALYTTGCALSPQLAKEREEDVKLHGPDGGPSLTSSDSGSEYLIDDQQTGGALSPQPAKEGSRMWSCTGQMEAPPPPAQTPALYTSGSALSPQPAKEREEDVKLHGPDGGPSSTSSDSGSVHNWRCTFSSTCRGEGGGCGAAWSGWRPLSHQLRLRC
jgi:hypothetical protein